MKKICFILPEHWSYAMGGAEFQVKCILEYLLENYKYKLYYLARNIDIHYTPVGYELLQIKNSLKLKKYGLFFDALPLISLLDSIAPDIIYQRIGSSYTGIAAFYKKRKKCKLVYHIAHDSDVKPPPNLASLNQININRFFDRKILQYGIKNADYIIAQSEYQKRSLLKNHNRLADQIIKNFHPAPNYKKKIPCGDKIRVLWVANFKSMKQPEVFIKLANDVSKITKNVRFTMIGRPAFWDPVWQNKLEKMIYEVDTLEYLGHKTIDEVNKYMEHSDIFVNTSKLEGFPNTFIQAWMRSVPVLSLHVDPDNILMKRNIGILAGSYDKLLHSLIYLIINDNIRTAMGTSAFEYSQSNHALKNIDKIVHIFDNI